MFIEQIFVGKNVMFIRKQMTSREKRRAQCRWLSSDPSCYGICYSRIMNSVKQLTDVYRAVLYHYFCTVYYLLGLENSVLTFLIALNVINLCQIFVDFLFSIFIKIFSSQLLTEEMSLETCQSMSSCSSINVSSEFYQNSPQILL